MHKLRLDATLKRLGRAIVYVQVKVKMVTSDDEKTTDIVLEGDVEEVERLRKVRGAAYLVFIATHHNHVIGSVHNTESGRK